jgi:hypothetical protein
LFCDIFMVISDKTNKNRRKTEIKIPVGFLVDFLGWVWDLANVRGGEGPPKKKKKHGKKIWRKATDRLFLFFFYLSAMRVGCGHATADGHPQLAAGSPFAS